MRFSRNPRTTPHVLTHPPYPVPENFPTGGGMPDNTACPKSNPKPHVAGGGVSCKILLGVCHRMRLKQNHLFFVLFEQALQALHFESTFFISNLEKERETIKQEKTLMEQKHGKNFDFSYF